jgi:signal transduction histidine kinase
VRVRVAREQAHAVVEVADVGEGMTEEYVRERLGKPFETTKSSGMGIGVYESSQYVTGVGGRLVIDSVRGQGTRVRVVLPLKDNAAAQAAAGAGSEEAPPPAVASPTETAASVGANS